MNYLLRLHVWSSLLIGGCISIGCRANESTPEETGTTSTPEASDELESSSGASSTAESTTTDESSASTVSQDTTDSSGENSGENTGEDSQSDSSTGTGTSDDSSDTADEDGLPKSYHYVRYDFPESDDSVACSGLVNDTAKIERVYLAQTHLMPSDWPFFFVVGDRPALLKVDIAGEGAAPEVRVNASVDGVLLESRCLRGPEILAESTSQDIQALERSFVTTVPRAWMVPGLSLEIIAGKATTNLSMQDLAIGAAPELNLAMVRVDPLNYNEGSQDLPTPPDFLANFAGAVPASKVRLGTFPERLVLPTLVVGGPDADPIVMTQKLCTDGQDPATDACEKVSGIGEMDISAAVLRFVGALLRATGDYPFTYFYGNTGKLNPGGWGGQKSFVGADFGDIFIHEMGHALGQPHWGEGWYKPEDPATSEYRYPYGGEKADGGGRGNSWGYAQDTGDVLSPICEDPAADAFGKERSDAMFRSMHCYEYRQGERGPWDGYSDYSSLSIFRWMSGAVANFSGEVPYRLNETPYFNFPEQEGFPTLKIDAAGVRSLVRDDPALETKDWETLAFYVPQQWDVPVHTVYGSYHPEFAAANIIYDPLSYAGNLPDRVDPSDAITFENLKQQGQGPYGGFFWWPKDVTLRFTYESGKVIAAIYPFDSVDRDWKPGSGPWRFDLLYWAITIPGDEELKKVELFERPFMVRNADMQDIGNINDAAQNITSQNFLDDAKLVVSREF